MKNSFMLKIDGNFSEIYIRTMILMKWLLPCDQRRGTLPSRNFCLIAA